MSHNATCSYQWHTEGPPNKLRVEKSTTMSHLRVWAYFCVLLIGCVSHTLRPDYWQIQNTCANLLFHLFSHNHIKKPATAMNKVAHAMCHVTSRRIWLCKALGILLFFPSYFMISSLAHEGYTVALLPLVLLAAALSDLTYYCQFLHLHLCPANTKSLWLFNTNFNDHNYNYTALNNYNNIVLTPWNFPIDTWGVNLLSWTLEQSLHYIIHFDAPVS